MSAAIDFFAVKAQEFCAWFCQFVGQANRFSVEGDEILLQGCLGKMAAQLFAQDNFKFLVQRDESRIECRVMKARKTKPITRVQPVIGEIAPRLDMTGHQQARDVDAANAAADAVGAQNRLTEKLLAAPDFYVGSDFGRPSWGDKSAARLKPNLVGFEEVHFLSLVSREQVVNHFLALGSKCGEMIVKFIPHGSVLLRRAGKSAHAASLLHRIKRGEIAQFHRKAVRGPAHFGRDFDDDGIAPVQLAESQCAVKIQCDKEMLARPFYCGCFRHV